MKTFPIYVPRDAYRGSNLARVRKRAEFNEAAVAIERHINDDLASQPDHTIHEYASYELASSLGMDSDLVHRVVYGIDAGANGVTICKGDIDQALLVFQQRDKRPNES